MMKFKKLVAFLIVFLGFLMLSFAQYEINTEVGSDRIAHLTAYIPNATTVELVGLGGSYGLYNLRVAFKDDGKGFWIASTPALESGFHYYGLYVNGIQTVNPNEKVLYYGGNMWNNGIEVPGDYDFYDLKDVPHGVVCSQYYKYLKQIRHCMVYLPPGYHVNTSESYPVLYLQHGNGESEYSWFMQGKANLILDNLLAEKKIDPMIVVCENGMNTDYTSLLVNGLMPFIEQKFRVKKEKEFRAVAGLSMGGNQTVTAAVNQIDYFNYMASFSSDVTASFNSSLNNSVELFWLGWGRDDEWVSDINAFEMQLNNRKVNHATTIYDGAHQWIVWRKCLYDYCQLIFKPYTYENPFVTSVELGRVQDSHFDVFPTHFTGSLFLKTDLNELQDNGLFVLSDISGKTIHQYRGAITNAESKINDCLVNCLPGVYFLKGQCSDYSKVVKLIK